MADTNGKKKLQPVLVEVLSPTDMMLGGYMAMGGGLGGGRLHIPDNPTVVFDQLFWNYPFAMYVYRDMEIKDAKVGGDLETRKESVLAKERLVVPASDKLRDRKVAEFVKETLEDYMGGSLVAGQLPFENVLREMMDAIGKGVAIGEIEWAIGSDGRVFAKNVHFRPQSLFSFSESPFGDFASYAYPQTGPLRLRPGLGFTLPNFDPEKSLEEQFPNKWVVHTPRPYQGNRFGDAVDREIFWAAWIKRGGIKGWLRFADKGTGTVVARYDQSPADAALALQAAQAIAEEQAVALAKRFETEVLEHSRANMGSTFKELVDDFCNSEISTRILGQTLTTRGGDRGSGSKALGQVHERVAQSKTSADAKALMLTINMQLVWPIVLYNFGPNVPPPMWAIKYAPGADLKLMSDVLRNGWEMGVPTSKKFYYETTQTAAPVDEADTLPAPKPDQVEAKSAGGNEGESAAFSEAEAFAEVHGIDVDKVIAFAESIQKKKSRQRFAAMRPEQLS